MKVILRNKGASRIVALKLEVLRPHQVLVQGQWISVGYCWELLVCWFVGISLLDSLVMYHYHMTHVDPNRDIINTLRS